MGRDTETRRGDEPARRLAAPVLVLGGSGMLGTAWRRLLTSAGVPHDCPARRRLDLTDREAVMDRVGVRFRSVINCAGWTDVDGAESNEAGAMALNADAPGHLAEASERAGATLVHYSTDYVFDGAAATPYRVDDEPRPATAYGRTKLEGERRVARSGCRHLIVRTSWLYAPWGSNFVLTMMGLLSDRAEVRVVDDQRGRPTSAEGLALTTARLLSGGATGVAHASDAGECTWHALASEIARLTGSTATVRPCTSAEFPRPAARPAYSVLDISETERVAGGLQDWRESLRGVVERAAARPRAARQGAA